MTPYGRSLHTPPLWFLLFAGLIISFIAYAIYKTIATNVQNSRAPLLERRAKVIGRRQEVWGRESTRTDYYVTFEFPDGTREELHMEGHQYGELVEGDQGTLRSQGTAYRGFERERQQTHA